MKKTALLLASMTMALMLVGAIALVSSRERAEAAFPGKNGKIVFARDPGMKPGSGFEPQGFRALPIRTPRGSNRATWTAGLGHHVRPLVIRPRMRCVFGYKEPE